MKVIYLILENNIMPLSVLNQIKAYRDLNKEKPAGVFAQIKKTNTPAVVNTPTTVSSIAQPTGVFAQLNRGSEQTAVATPAATGPSVFQQLGR